jgi:hypothetical protein
MIWDSTKGQYGGPEADPLSLFPDSDAAQGEPSLWSKMQASTSTTNPKRKAIVDAMLMKLATPNFQHPPAFQPSDPFRYYPQ